MSKIKHMSVFLSSDEKTEVLNAQNIENYGRIKHRNFEPRRALTMLDLLKTSLMAMCAFMEGSLMAQWCVGSPTFSISSLY